MVALHLTGQPPRVEVLDRYEEETVMEQIAVADLIDPHHHLPRSLVIGEGIFTARTIELTILEVVNESSL